MRFFYSKSFRKDYRKPSKINRKIVDEKLTLFTQNLRHPSLSVKKMEGLRNIWEARITKKYRFTFQISDGVVILRRVGAHDILDKM